MKILIDNYSTPFDKSTQSLSFSKLLSNQDEHTCLVNDFSKNIFDLFDEYTPDIYITSINTITTHSLQYIVESRKEIQLLINVDNSKYAYMKQAVEILKENKIKAIFFGENINGCLAREKTIKIIGALDEFLDVKKIDFSNNINYLVLCSNVEQIEKEMGDISKKQNITFHVAAQGVKADFTNDIQLIKSIAHNYDSIIFSDLSPCLSQCFFECLGLSRSISAVSHESENINTTISKIMKKDLHICHDDLITAINNPTLITDDVKQTVRDKHTYSSRLKTILSQTKGGIVHHA